jgi:ABC-type uncharacterized transport system ATPase subunit
MFTKRFEKLLTGIVVPDHGDVHFRRAMALSVWRKILHEAGYPATQKLIAWLEDRVRREVK